MIEGPKNIPQAAELMNTQLSQINPDCRFVVVVPVYKEFKFGRITKLLTELDDQTIGRDQFETILVVNNPGFRKEPADEEGFADNLELIDFVELQKLGGRFGNVQVINCTNGELPARHLGLIRGLGNETARIRLAQTSKGENGVIVQMDADASLDTDFLWRLDTVFQSTPSAQSVGIPRSPLPVDYPSDDLYLHLARQFLRTVTCLREGISPGSFNGSTLSFKAYLHQRDEIRTYMGYSMNEDYKLGEDLYKYSRFIYTPEPRIFVADRRRLEGFDANLRCCIAGQVSHLSVQMQDGMKEYFQREEDLARSRLNWDIVNESLVRMGILLFCQGRMAMGEGQMVKTYLE